MTEPLRAIPDRAMRLRAFFERWIDWLDDSGLSGGCPILAAAIEFDDVPGPVHDAAARHFGALQRWWSSSRAPRGPMATRKRSAPP